MPRVPTVSRQVSPNALPGARLTAALTPQAAGAGAANAQAGLSLARGRASAEKWGAISQFGDQVQRTGQVLGQMAIQEQRRADEVALMDADNQLSKWTTENLYDPRSGALTLQGRDALGAPEAVNERFEKFAGEVEASLGTPRQREAFARLRNNRGAQLDLTLRRHVYGEMQKYEATELDSFLKNKSSDAITNSNDPRAVGMAIAEGVDAIERSGPRMGLGPEQVKQQTEAFTSQAHVGVIESMLNQGNTRSAQVYFEEVKDAGQLSGEAQLRVERALKEGNTRRQAQQKADEILAAGGSLTEQRNKAKEIDDPDVRDNVMQRLEHEADVNARASRQAEEDTLRGVYNTLEGSGGDLTAISPTTWAGLDASVRGPIRAYARSLAKGEPIETDLEVYYSLMNRATSNNAGFLKENLLKYRDKLSEGDFQQMANLQRGLREHAIEKAEGAAKTAGKTVIDEFQSRTAVFNDRIAGYGLDPSPKEGTPEAKALANLRGIVDRRVRALGGGETGKSATNEEVRAIIDEEFRSMATAPNRDKWWFQVWAPDTVQKRAFELTIGDITAKDRQLIEQALRRRGVPVNDTTVLETFIEAQSRRN